MYIDLYKVEKQVKLIYGEVSTVIILQQVSAGKGMGDVSPGVTFHQAIFLGIVFFSVYMLSFNKKLKRIFCGYLLPHPNPILTKTREGELATDCGIISYVQEQMLAHLAL